MGFFDDMKALFDTKKTYDEEDLKIYFKHEIDGTCNIYIDKEKITTNISEIVSGQIKVKYPNMNSWSIENGSSTIENCGDGVYVIKYKGKIIKISDVYGDSLDNLHYDIIVYTNKYAELVSDDERKTTIKVW